MKILFVCFFSEMSSSFENVQAHTALRGITQYAPLAAEVLTPIAGVKTSCPPADSCGRILWLSALSSKPCEKQWPPDAHSLTMTLRVQFVDIFSVSQYCSFADIDSVKPACWTAGGFKTVASHTTVLCAGRAVPWIRWW